MNLQNPRSQLCSFQICEPEQSYGKGSCVVTFCWWRETVSVSLCYTNQLVLHGAVASSKVLDSLSSPSPEPLSQDGEAWEEEEAHWAF